MCQKRADVNTLLPVFSSSYNWGIGGEGEPEGEAEGEPEGAGEGEKEG
jgi:hypothetical protein